MPIAPLLIGLVIGQSQDKVVYKDPKLGLQFEVPKTWRMRKTRDAAVFEVPGDGGQVATVQLFTAKFKDTAEMWQMIQGEINKGMRRTVDRQWQEEYLGVPMLLTKVSYDEGGHTMSSVTGLLYTAYESKMNFRLVSTAAQSEQAEQAWKEAMLSLRTINGELPSAENVDKPSVKPEPLKPVTVLRPKTEGAKPVRGSNSVSFASFRLALPTGWTVQEGFLKHSGFSGSLGVDVSVGLAEDAWKRIEEAAKADFSSFESIKVRQDTLPTHRKSGATTVSVYRIGSAANSPLVTGQFAGACEGVYFVLSYRSVDDAAAKSDRKLLDELLELMYAEKA